MLNDKVKKILIIAGSDSSGGAGIAADIKAACAFNIHPATTISCLTAQNSHSLNSIFIPPARFLKAQIEAVLDALSISAIKIGMLGNKKTVQTLAQILRNDEIYKKIKIILDPVMMASSGAILLEETAIKSFKEKLIPLSYLITPNIHEAEILAQMKINNLAQMKIAAQKIAKLGARNILIKGGHFEMHKSTIRHLFLNEKGGMMIFTNKRKENKSKNNKMRGTGCSLATAIASLLAKDYDLENAIRKANKFIYLCYSCS